MKQKKAPEKDVDKRTLLFRQIGFVLALIIVIIAFEWRTYDEADFELESELHIDEDEEMADVTQQQEVPPPPPPPEIEVVEDDAEIEEDQDIHEQDFDDDLDDFVYDNQEDEVVEEEEVFTVVEDEPGFPGGQGALNQFLRDNIEYPSYEREAGEQGRVIVTFVVETDGSISEIEIRDGDNENFNAEAKRVVREMPRWEPGRQRGQAVRVRVNLPITFRLR